jgi:hypothetical protein
LTSDIQRWCSPQSLACVLYVPILLLQSGLGARADLLCSVAPHYPIGWSELITYLISGHTPKY